MSLWEAFRCLPAPRAGVAYSVEITSSNLRAAKSASGNAALLVRFKHQASSTPRRLLNLVYLPPSPVALVSGTSAPRTENLAVIECRSDDHELQKYFFRIAEAALLEGSSDLDEEHFEHALDKLVMLFRALRRPATRSIQGVWAELALVYWSPEPSLAISNWHSSPSALHDFASGDFKLEVKSTQSKLREHHFRQAQLAAIQTGDTLVASIQLVETVGGASVFDLLELLRAGGLATTESLARVETILAETLGQDWHSAQDVQFGLAQARQSLRIYNAVDVPTIPQPLPAGIRDVHFIADLSTLTPLDLAQARAHGALYASLLPAE